MFLYRKLSDIVRQAEEFSQRSVTTRFLHQGRDKGTIEMMKEDLKAAINIFNVCSCPCLIACPSQIIIMNLGASWIGNQT